MSGRAPPRKQGLMIIIIIRMTATVVLGTIHVSVRSMYGLATTFMGERDRDITIVCCFVKKQ